MSSPNKNKVVSMVEKAIKPAPKSNFKLTKKGIYFCADDADDIFICSPLEIIAVTSSVNDDNYGRWIEYTSTKGITKRMAIPMTMTASDSRELSEVLLSNGLTNIGSGKAKALLIQYLRTRPDKHLLCVTKTGWHDGRYVLPSETIGGNDDNGVVFQSATGQPNNFNQQDTLEQWQQHIAKPVQGNSRLMFALSCAFAAPVMELLNVSDGGGFNLRGSSSSGKSTALQVAASVCGSREYVNTWRATDNGLEGTALAHNDALLILDEMGQVDPKKAGEIVYMVANGFGKQRANKSGMARAVTQWRTLLLSSGELSLAEHIRSTGQRAKAGQELRLVDIPMDTGKHSGFEELNGFSDGAALADHLKDASSKYYGVAFHQFIQYLVKNQEQIRPAAKLLYNSFIAENCPSKISGQVQRVAARFALVAVGGELATEAGITGWNDGDATQAAAICFKEWFDEHGSTGDMEASKALSQVRAFIQENQQSRFASWDCQGDKTIINKAGYIEQIDNGKRFYIFQSTFNNEVCSGLNNKHVIGVLKDHGLLHHEINKSMIKRKPADQKKTIGMYCITDDIFTVGDDNV